MYLGPDSLALADMASSLAKGKRVADLCAGSGIQGLVATRAGASSITWVEAEARAAAFCRLNGALNCVEGDVVVDRVNNVQGGTYDLILANPPYVATPPSSSYEAFAAGGPDGRGSTNANTMPLLDNPVATVDTHPDIQVGASAQRRQEQQLRQEQRRSPGQLPPLPAPQVLRPRAPRRPPVRRCRQRARALPTCFRFRIRARQGRRQQGCLPAPSRLRYRPRPAPSGLWPFTWTPLPYLECP